MESPSGIVPCYRGARFTRGSCGARPVTQGAVSVPTLSKGITMNNLLRTGIAGFAAWKWGGGLLGTIILFLIVYYLLGYLH